MNPIDFARLFLDPRGRRGRLFRFVPKMTSMGLQPIALTGLDGNFHHTAYIRPGTTDMEVFHHIFVYRCYDTRRFDRHADIGAAYAPGESLILDLGAYTGLSSLYFANQFPEARVVAVEPDSGNYDLLVKNTRGLNIDQLRAAVGKDDGWAVIGNPGDQAYALRTVAAVQTTPGAIRSISIPFLLKQYSAFRPFICKIDVEGAERDLFDDISWVDDFAVIIIELHDWLFPKERTAGAFLRAVCDLDRDFVVHGENVFSIKNRP